MKTDSRTGMKAFTRAEVEDLNPHGTPAEIVDWGRWPRLAGYLVRAAERVPFKNPSTGEGMFGDEMTKRCVIVRTRYGHGLIWDDHDDLAELFSAEPGAPFAVTFRGHGEGFDVTVGRHDDEPEQEPQPTSHAALLEAARAVDLSPVDDDEAAEAALLAAAAAIIHPER